MSEERGTLVADTLQPPADNHAGAAYRHHVAQELTRRTLAAALAEARAAAPVAASR
ncbi:hypothetical protein [Pseudonocardia sp. NPDC049154]|uniref:hypothetical protein n=1 Tax=Pseudonocardia sp. NPDC049154 TaxID=3155501 RepID=UPI003400AFAD